MLVRSAATGGRVGGMGVCVWRPPVGAGTERPSLPSTFPSLRVFSNESVLPIRWPKYWSFNFSLSPSNDYTGLISFTMDWLDFLAV